jgi:membrane fusion protein (multidrug efflux system)
MFKDRRIHALVAIIAVTMLWLVTRRAENDTPAVEPRVTVAKVTLQPWVDEMEAIGTARANESLNITATVTETIAEIHFVDGQEVEIGDPIVSLALGEEAAQLAAAHARLEEEKRELARLQPLIKSKAVAQRLYDERKTAVVLAERAVQQVKARVNDRAISAPFAGVLGLRYVSVGTLVEPGDLITTLDDIETIKLDFPMPAVFLSSIKVGGTILARTPAYPDKTFKGQVASVDSRIDPDTRSIIVRAILKNEDHELRPGILMYVTLQKNAREALSVPEEALIPVGQKVSAYVVDEAGKVVVTPIKIGARHNGMVEIVEGLQEGQSVIIRGHQSVRGDQKVNATEIDGLTASPQ